MSISQRNDGRYLVKYKDRMTRQWKQKSFRDLASAEAFEAETTYDKEENYRITVAESIVAFLKAVPHCAKEVKAIERLIEGPMSILATRYVDTLTRRDLETARDAIKAASKGISNHTVNRYVGVFIAAWRWCASEDLLDKVPWAQYRKLPEERPGTNCGDRAEFMRVYESLPSEGQWAVRTLLALCCRPGKELAGVTWSCIDLDRAVARIWMPKVKAEKTVHLPAWWVEEARPRRESAEPEHLVCRSGRRGDRPLWLDCMWKRAKARLGIHRCPLYTARHLAASMMLEAGADAAAVAAQLGHRNVTTTGTYYIHASAKGQEAAASHLPDLVRVGAGNPCKALETKDNIQ